jgi:hypothetical protein
MPRSIVWLPSTNDDDGRISAAGLGLQRMPPLGSYRERFMDQALSLNYKC